MKVVQINVTCGAGSTGKICVGISKVLTAYNVENYILYSSGQTNYSLGIKYSNEKYTKLQALISRVNGKYGFNSNYATKCLIKKLKDIKPDILHLHNLHGHNCNLEMLFNYVKKNDIKIIWTFHDCWAITGYCPHFSMINCNKWKTLCMNCPQYRNYSWLRDRSEMLFKKKKSLMDALNLTIVTPSEWLAGIVKESFLSSKNVRVINNGIDLSVFSPKKSSLKEYYNIPAEKKIVLGVAFNWNLKKGLDVFSFLADNLDPDKYQIILVGTSNKVEKHLSDNIITIRRTQDQHELAEIYSQADVFVNPTREDTFPTVNIEALACGTPVITFRTGGSPEIVTNDCGRVVMCDDKESMLQYIINLSEEKVVESDKCVERASMYERNTKFNEYYRLYLECME